MEDFSEVINTVIKDSVLGSLKGIVYRRALEHLAKLKINPLTITNDSKKLQTQLIEKSINKAKKELRDLFTEIGWNPDEVEVE